MAQSFEKKLTVRAFCPDEGDLSRGIKGYGKLISLTTLAFQK
jgi:hypothetical protein